MKTKNTRKRLKRNDIFAMKKKVMEYIYIYIFFGNDNLTSFLIRKKTEECLQKVVFVEILNWLYLIISLFPANGVILFCIVFDS